MGRPQPEDDETLLGDTRWAGFLIAIVGFVWVAGFLGVFLCVIR